MDGGAQAGLVAMAGLAFRGWEPGHQREALPAVGPGHVCWPGQGGVPMVKTFMKPNKAWKCIQEGVHFSSFGDQGPVLC